MCDEYLGHITITKLKPSTLCPSSTNVYCEQWLSLTHRKLADKNIKSRKEEILYST